MFLALKRAILIQREISFISCVFIFFFKLEITNFVSDFQFQESKIESDKTFISISNFLRKYNTNIIEIEGCVILNNNNNSEYVTINLMNNFSVCDKI